MSAIFSYDHYFNGMFLLPLIITLAMVAVFVIVTIRFILSAKKKGNKTKDLILQIGGSILCFVIIYTHVLPLINGGIFLPFEKGTPAVGVSGIIENIVEPSELIPNFKASFQTGNGIEHASGADITINGTTYFAVMSAGFSKGDYVKVCFLPQSKIVLCIETISPEKTPS